jgi:hypothetical protein
MAGTNDRHRVRPHLWLIRFIGLIVPRHVRADWQQEWETELRYREMLLADWDRLDWRHKLDLVWRSTSAFWDAFWLQRRRLETEMFEDLRYGVRMMLFTHPGFTAVAVVTLALGIGANTAIFTLLDKVLIRQLPVERPDQLVTFVEDAIGAPRIFSYPVYADLRDGNNVLAGLVAYSQRPFSLNDGNLLRREPDGSADVRGCPGVARWGGPVGVLDTGAACNADGSSGGTQVRLASWGSAEALRQDVISTCSSPFRTRNLRPLVSLLHGRESHSTNSGSAIDTMDLRWKE